VFKKEILQTVRNLMNIDEQRIIYRMINIFKVVDKKIKAMPTGKRPGAGGTITYGTTATIVVAMPPAGEKRRVLIFSAADSRAYWIKSDHDKNEIRMLTVDDLSERDVASVHQYSLNSLPFEESLF